MANLSQKDIQTIRDSAWRAGFECGLTIRMDRTADDVEALLNLLKSAEEYSSDDEDDIDDEIDVELNVGDIVELERGKYYILCKIDGDNIVAVDPPNKRLVSGKKSDILSVGKLDLADEDD